MSVNLIHFYSVQLCTGQDSRIFLSRDEAVLAAKEWDAEVFQSFEKGEGNYAQSEIDYDGVHYSVNPVFLSGTIYSHEPGKAKEARWSDSPDFNKVRWGNPALQRGVRQTA
jgi:hypothetical protein